MLAIVCNVVLVYLKNRRICTVPISRRCSCWTMNMKCGSGKAGGRICRTRITQTLDRVNCVWPSSVVAQWKQWWNTAASKEIMKIESHRQLISFWQDSNLWLSPHSFHIGRSMNVSPSSIFRSVAADVYLFWIIKKPLKLFMSRDSPRVQPNVYKVRRRLTNAITFFSFLLTRWTDTQDGRSPDESQPIQDVLDRLKRTTYTMSELHVRPLPEGVDPTRLESYLTVDDFQVRQSITFVHKKKKGNSFLIVSCSGHPLLTSLKIGFSHIFFFYFYIKGNNGHDQTGILRFTRLETDTT